MTSVKVKGTKITSKLEFVRTVFGPEAVDRLLAALPEQDRAEARGLLEFAWYRQDLYDHVVDTIRTLLAGGDPAVFERMGRYSAEHQLGGSYKASLKPDIVKSLRNQAPVHAMLNDPGRMEVEFPRDGECRLIVSAPKSSAAGCAIARAFYKRALELQGARDIAVLEPRCSAMGAPACEFHLSWKT